MRTFFVTMMVTYVMVVAVITESHAGLRAGAAQREITPAVGLEIQGNKGVRTLFLSMSTCYTAGYATFFTSRRSWRALPRFESR